MCVSFSLLHQSCPLNREGFGGRNTFEARLLWARADQVNAQLPGLATYSPKVAASQILRHLVPNRPAMG